MKETQVRRLITVLQALSPEIFNFKGFEHGLMEFALPNIEADSWAYAINRVYIIQTEAERRRREAGVKQSMSDETRS